MKNAGMQKYYKIYKGDKIMISVIVPIYNSEKYLSQCIESILNQTYKDIELILVDDGSTDTSGKICDEYAEKDKRVIVYHNSHSGFAAVGRNRGLDLATGDYIGFIDSDDYISEDMYEKLINDIKLTNAEIAICGYSLYYQDFEKFESDPVKTTVIEGNYNVNKCFAVNLSNGTFNFQISCNKLFKRTLIQNIKFEAVHVGEDVTFNCRAFLKCNKFVTNSKCMYFYRRHGENSTSGKFTEKRLENIYSAVVAYELYKNHPKLNSLAEYILALVQIKCAFNYNLVNDTVINEKDKKKCFDLIEDVYKKYCSTKSYIEVINKEFELNAKLRI